MVDKNILLLIDGYTEELKYTTSTLEKTMLYDHIRILKDIVRKDLKDEPSRLHIEGDI